MRGSILSYFDMCQTEKTSLQRGMNFRLRGGHSVFLMSVRKGAPYHDRVEDEGLTLIYEGHDAAKTAGGGDPKSVDQPERLGSGRLTENGKFFEAAQRYKREGRGADLVRVYEKVRDGIWADNGYFELVDAWQENDGCRNVFKFRLKAVESAQEELGATDPNIVLSRSRMIPSAVKQAVWERDNGACTMCGAKDELHFDHIIPYSKGGSSMVVANIQLLCARHNLDKSAKIE